MTLVTNRKEYLGKLAHKCHVCHRALNDGVIIEHTGNVLFSTKGIPDAEGYGSIGLHQECAVILMLRLSHDVMSVRKLNDRMPDKLRHMRDTATLLEQVMK